MSWLTSIPFFGIVLTLLAYWIGTLLFQASRQFVLLNPTVVGIVLLGSFLTLSGVDYRQYFNSAEFLHWLLGIATISLAFPLASNIRHLKENVLAVLVAVNAGALAGILSGYALVRYFGGSHQLAISMAPKATTTPIAIGISQTLGGSLELSAVFAVCGGIIAVFVFPLISKYARISDWRAIGLGASTGGSGLATAMVAPLHPLSAAFTGIGLSLNGIFTAIWTPLLVPYLALWFH
jgi:putative effector of murein hydrolase